MNECGKKKKRKKERKKVDIAGVAAGKVNKGLDHEELCTLIIEA